MCIFSLLTKKLSKFTFHEYQVTVTGFPYLNNTKSYQPLSGIYISFSTFELAFGMLCQLF